MRRITNSPICSLKISCDRLDEHDRKNRNKYSNYVWDGEARTINDFVSRFWIKISMRTYKSNRQIPIDGRLMEFLCTGDSLALARSPRIIVSALRIIHRKHFSNWNTTQDAGGTSPHLVFKIIRSVQPYIRFPILIYVNNERTTRLG